MSFEDNDNIYVLEEETEEDKSPLNFAAYNDEDREETIEEQQVGEAGSAIGLLFRIMVNPVEGWKRLRRSGLSVEKLQAGCFYPILALLSVSTFAEYFYSVSVNLSELVTQAVVAFVAYFFGYFCVMMVMNWIFPKEMAEKIESTFGKAYFIISMSSLVLFTIVTNLLPMIWPILIFLPVWTFYFMFKGVRFFHFPREKETRFYVIAVVAAVGMPLLIDRVLNAILPY